MEGKWLPNSLMKWDMFVFGQCILAPVQRKKMSSQISLRRGLKKKGETTNCSTKLLDLTKPFRLQSQAGSQNYSHSHPTPHPWRKNGQCLLPEIIPVSIWTRHECYFFPGREWEAAAGLLFPNKCHSDPQKPFCVMCAPDFCKGAAPMDSSPAFPSPNMKGCLGKLS